MNTVSAFNLRIDRRTCKRFSGMLRPLAFSETILAIALWLAFGWESFVLGDIMWSEKYLFVYLPALTWKLSVLKWYKLKNLLYGFANWQVAGKDSPIGCQEGF